MLDLAAIRENPDAIREGARRKRIAFDVDRLLALDEDRRRLIRLQEEARAEQKALGRQVKDLQGDAQQLALTRLKVLKDDVLRHTEALAPVQAEIDALLLACPNPPDPDVPDGDDDKANVEVRRHGEPPTLAVDLSWRLAQLASGALAAGVAAAPGSAGASPGTVVVVAATFGWPSSYLLRYLIDLPERVSGASGNARDSRSWW